MNLVVKFITLSTKTWIYKEKVNCFQICFHILFILNLSNLSIFWKKNVSSILRNFFLYFIGKKRVKKL